MAPHYKIDANRRKCTKTGSGDGFWLSQYVVAARNCNKQSWGVLALWRDDSRLDRPKRTGKRGKKRQREMTVMKQKMAVQIAQKWPPTCFSPVINEYGMHSHATAIIMDGERQMMHIGQQK